MYISVSDLLWGILGLAGFALIIVFIMALI